MTIFIVCLVTVIIGALVGILTKNPFWGLGISIALIGIFVLQGTRKIPAQPPNKGILTFLGKRTNVVIDEGWHFFPFFPWLYGIILIDVSKKERDIPAESVRTPDLAELKIPISITWTPSYEDTKDANGNVIFKGGDDLKEFLNSGGEKGVNAILEDIIRERLREWAMSSSEGPQSWEEAIGAKEEAAAILLKAILGETLDPIPSGIPTPVLLKCLNSPPRKPTKEECILWGKNWETATNEIGQLSDEERDQLFIAVRKRKSEIAKVRQGNGHFKIHQLGITLNRLNIGEAKPLGKLAEAAESQVKEAQERRGEVFEVETDLLKAAELIKAATATGETLSTEEAFRIIMEWKATREGKGFTIPGVSPAIKQILEVLLRR